MARATFKSIIRGVALAGFLAGSVLACTGSVPAQDNTKTKVIVVSGPPFLAFFAPLKMGVEQATKDLGVDVQYATSTGPDNPGARVD